MKTKKSLLEVAIGSFLGLLVAFQFTSCSPQQMSDVYPDAGSYNDRQHRFLSDEEASSQAKEVYSLLFPSDTAHGNPPETRSVQKTRILRSADRLTTTGGVIVVNFRDNKGYVVLSESKNNEPILYACDNGHLDISKVSDNPNLLSVLSNTDALMEYNSRVETQGDKTVGGNQGNSRYIL